jgi:epoxyqueuosine reductase
MGLRQSLIDAGRAAGLVGVGVCGVEPFSEVKESLEDRVETGMSARMRFTFADPATATDVRSSLPWARSLVVGAHAYLPAAGSPGPGREASARIARFAAEDHYEPLRSALDAVADVLRAADHRTAVLVDDNRLVDRAAAVRAGVAWWGKNTMALVPGAGPWVLLGSIVTDAVLEADAPMRRTCGTCEDCLPACPTGALVEPGVLDARKCIAYWLQAPGSIPRDLRPAIGDRLYGCDDCLDACPPGGRLLVRSRTSAGRVDVRHLLAMADRPLLERFERFYVPRNDPRYLRRNALVVLGNTGIDDDAGLLAGYAGHRDPLLREHAVWALGRAGGNVARSVIEAVSTSDPHPAVRGEALAFLGGSAA